MNASRCFFKKSLGRVSNRLPELSFQVFTSISNITAKEWESAGGAAGLFWSHSFLSVVENHPPKGMQFRYALFYLGKVPVGKAYFQIVELSGESFGSSILLKEGEDSRFRKWLKDVFLSNAERVSFRMLISGTTLISGEYASCFSSALSGEQSFHALSLCVQELLKKEKRVSLVLVKDFYKETLRSSNTLKHEKYRAFEADPNMILSFEPSWQTNADYLNALSKKYRNRVKNIRKKGLPLVVRELSAHEIEKNSGAIDNLFEQVASKAQIRLANLDSKYFHGMKKELPSEFSFYGYFLKDRMLAFRTSFRNGDSLEAHFIGMDYSLNREYELYQNMLYDFIEEAFQKGLRTVYFGRTASEIKSNVGAKPFALTCYLKNPDSLTNRFLKPFLKVIQSEEWIQRNPFKAGVENEKIAELSELS
jgi:hypothetical protein